MAINYEFIQKKKAERAQQQTVSKVKQLSGVEGTNFDPNTSEGLYNLALQHGGRPAEVIASLKNPRTNLMTSIGDRIKTLGKGVLDVLSFSGETMAGVIEYAQEGGNFTDQMKKAYKNDLSISEALLGKYDGTNKNFAEKAGALGIRFGLDILLDPLSYVTGGGAKGIMGFSALRSVKAGETVATKLGTKVNKKIFLKEGVGDDLHKLAELKLKRASNELTDPIKKRLKDAGIGDDIIGEALQKQTDDLLSIVDAKTIDFDTASEAVTRLLELKPDLTEYVLDKGGIKFFGKTILEGQKIRAVANALPIVTKIDKATEPYRMALGAAFSPNIQKFGKKYEYVGDDFLRMQKQVKQRMGDEANGFLKQYNKVFQELGFKTTDEMNAGLAAVLYNKTPVDPKLVKLKHAMEGLNDQNFLKMARAGSDAPYQPGYIAHIHKADEVDLDNAPDLINKNISSMFSDKLDSEKMKKNVSFEDMSNPNNVVLATDPDKVNSLSQISINKEIKVIQDEVKEELAKNYRLVEGDVKYIEKQKELVSKKYKEKISSTLADKFSKAGISSPKMVAKKLAELAPDIEVNDIVSRRLKTGYSNGVKIKVKSLTKKEGEELRKKLQVSGVEIEKINEILKDIPKKESVEKGVKKTKKKVDKKKVDKKKVDKKKVDKEKVQQVYDDLIKNVSKEDIDKIAAEIANGFTEGKGTKRFSDNIIKTTQNIKDTLEDLNDISRSKSLQVDKLLKASEKLTKNLDNEIERISKNTFLSNKDKSELTYRLKNQIDDIKSGKIDNVYIDDVSDKVFFRRMPKFDEALTMSGYTFDMEDADWLDNLKDQGLNLVEDVISAGVKTTSQSVNKAFVADIARFGIPVDRAPSDFGVLDINKKILDTNGVEVAFPKHFKEQFERLAAVMSKPKVDDGIMLEAYDSVLSVWKSSVTSMFGSFHFRNGLSNVMLNTADLGYHALDPKTNHTALNLINMNKKYNALTEKIYSAKALNEGVDELITQRNRLLNKPILNDQKYKDTYTFGQLQDILKNNNIAFTDMATGTVFDEARVGKKTFSQAMEDTGEFNYKKLNPLIRDFYGYEGGRAVGEFVENHGRLVNFLGNMKNVGDVHTAAARTKQFLFDYGALSDFERRWMRRVIPFYSFTRFNLEAQAKLVMSSPGRAAAQVKSMKTFTDVWSSDDLTDEEKEMLPSYMTRGYYYSKKMKDGTIKNIKISDSPTTQPLDAFTSQGILGSISPLLRIPLEQATGFDMWQGKPFSDVTNASAYRFFPKPIKDFIGYYDYDWTDNEGKTHTWHASLRPSNMNLLNNLPPTSRVIGAFRDVTSEDKTVSQKALNFLTGINARDVDIEKLYRYEEKKTMEEYEDRLDAANVIYSFSRNIVNKDK